jgi:hypothetical protein
LPVSESEHKSAGRRIKLAFWVGDADTGERLCETQQCVMEFKQSELDALRQNVRDKFPESPQDVVDKLAAPLHLGWSREIVNAGFLSVSKYAQNLVLKHLGYPTAEEMLAEQAQAKAAE